jgi:hypothetical protein
MRENVRKAAKAIFEENLGVSINKMSRIQVI